MFKPQPPSKDDGQPQNTLDVLHTDMMAKFAEEKSAAQAVLAKTHELDADSPKRKSAENSIRKRLKNIDQREADYLLDSSPHVFTYFENKKDVTGGGSKHKRLLTSFFYGNSDAGNQATSETERYLEKYDSTGFDIERYVVDVSQCDCGGELVPVVAEGVSICKVCGLQKAYIVEHEKPSFREPPKEVCFYAYKRINHFREILAQFQAKETTQIPEHVMLAIRHQVKKERITIADLSNQKTKDILKKLGFNKYYEHIPFIKDKLGIKPPIMSPRLEEKLCSLFLEVEKQYAKHCPDHRVNFLNYYYVLYKMCELLKETTFLRHFPMLKDPVKRIEQDAIWRKICNDLGWTFVPTM